MAKQFQKLVLLSQETCFIKIFRGKKTNELNIDVNKWCAKKCTLKILKTNKNLCMFLIRNYGSSKLSTSRILSSFVLSIWQQVLTLNMLLAGFLQAFSLKLSAITLRSPLYTHWIPSRTSTNIRQISNQCRVNCFA